MQPLRDLYDPLAAALLGGGALLAVAALGALAWRQGRLRRRDVRELVAFIEDLRSARPRRHVAIDSASALGPVVDAVGRLGQDLATRRSENAMADQGLRAILEAAHDYAVVTADADWDVLTASPGAEEMFGLAAEAMVGLSASVLFDEASWTELIPKIAPRGRREPGADGRYTMVRSDGTRFPARVAVRHRRGASADAGGFLIVVHDVTEDVRLESELRASEGRYRFLVEGLPEAVAVMVGGSVVYANPSFAALLGLDPSQAEGLRLRDRVATTDVFVLQDVLARLDGAADGERAELRVRLTGARGGSGAAVRLAAIAMRHEGAPATLVTLRDETAERRVDAELRRNETRLDAVVEAAAEGLVVLADTPGGGVVAMTNAAFARLTGLDRGQVLGASEAALAVMLRERGDGGARFAAMLTAKRTEPATAAFQLEGAGAPRVVDVVVGPMRGPGGRRDGRIVVVRDVSDARTAEQGLLSNVDELRRAKENLETAYRELQAEREEVTRRQDDLVRLNTELRSLDSMKSDLLANVSHELQTPLVSIRGYTEMILKERLGPLNDEQRKGLTLSLRNIDRLIALIDNLLSFSRADRGAGEMNISVFPIAAVVDEALDLLKDRIEARRLAVAKNFEDPDVETRADRDKILQVFVNLLSNAVKFNSDQGSIEIVVRGGKPGFVLLQIHDTGIGIPEQDIEKVFDRFYRVAPPADVPSEGSGIGLAIVRGILRLHGCVIRAASRLGEGTTFTFTLPLAAQPAVGEAPGPQPERSATIPAAAPNGRTGPAPSVKIIRRD